MKFCVLGPLRVEAAGCVVPVTSARQRAVLAVLLLRANCGVGAAELIGQVWGQDCPASARNLVHTYIWRLRCLLGEHEPGAGAARISYGADGYRVAVAEGELDAQVFQQQACKGLAMLAEGGVAAASGILAGALALWSGESLSNLDVAGAAAAECARLAELRRQALSARIEADLILGQHAVVAAELRKLVAEDPLDEKLYLQLMTALSQSGRRGDALQVYAQARHHLAAELGLEPCTRLRHLQAAILRGDPAPHTCHSSSHARPSGW